MRARLILECSYLHDSLDGIAACVGHRYFFVHETFPLSLISFSFHIICNYSTENEAFRVQQDTFPSTDTCAAGPEACSSFVEEQKEGTSVS